MASPNDKLKEFKKNTKSVKGNTKNAIKLSGLAPEPISKFIVFLIVFLTPMVMYFFMAAVLVLLASGLVTAIIVKDPDIGYNDIKEESSGGSENNRDMSVPESVKGKFLVSWNAESISSPQGERKGSAIASKDHWGIDFQPTPKIASEQTLAMFPIYPGTVYKVSTTANDFPLGKGYGNAVVVKHDIDGTSFYSLYGHFRYVKVKEGESVGFKTHLGRMGCTGNSEGTFEGCGTHLHFELYNSNYGVNGRNKHNLLRIADYLTCGDNLTLKNKKGNYSHCVKYRNEKVGSVPKIE